VQNNGDPTFVTAITTTTTKTSKYRLSLYYHGGWWQCNFIGIFLLVVAQIVLQKACGIGSSTHTQTKKKKKKNPKMTPT
jgi:hypothetical protein